MTFSLQKIQRILIKTIFMVHKRPWCVFEWDGCNFKVDFCSRIIALIHLLFFSNYFIVLKLAKVIYKLTWSVYVASENWKCSELFEIRIRCHEFYMADKAVNCWRLANWCATWYRSLFMHIYKVRKLKLIFVSCTMYIGDEMRSRRERCYGRNKFPIATWREQANNKWSTNIKQQIKRKITRKKRVGIFE
jgi:hypothetical protein